MIDKNKKEEKPDDNLVFLKFLLYIAITYEILLFSIIVVFFIIINI